MKQRSLPALLRLLAEPAAAIPESERRRARLLGWLQLALLALTGVSLLVVFLFNPAGGLVRGRLTRRAPGLLVAAPVPKQEVSHLPSDQVEMPGFRHHDTGTGKFLRLVCLIVPPRRDIFRCRRLRSDTGLQRLNSAASAVRCAPTRRSRWTS